MTHVIFGTGPLGLSVMRALLLRGESVRMVNTSGRAAVPDTVDVVRADAYSVDDATAACAGARVVYQCAMPPYTEWVARFPPLQATILAAAERRQATLAIGDNLYLYGPVSGPIHDALPAAATTRKGRLRAEMSQAALAAHAAGRLPVVIARGSDFFGPGVLNAAIGERAIVPALAGRSAQVLGRVDIAHTFTFIDDFGEALVRLAAEPSSHGQAWHVPNDRPTITQRELLEQVFAAAGHPAKIANLRLWAMKFVAPFSPLLRESLEMMYAFESPYVVDSTRYERAFGHRATPIADAVRATVAWYRSRATAAPRA